MGKHISILLLGAFMVLPVPSLWAAFTYQIIDLGTFGGNEGFKSAAFDINENGQVVGYAEGDSGIQAFFYDYYTPAGIEAIGSPGTQSVAYGINDSAQVVGYSTSSDFSNRQGFLWDNSSGIANLGTLGGSYSEARSINNSGQVVGYSEKSDGNEEAFIYDSTDSSAQLEGIGTLGGNQSQAYDINDSGHVAGTSGTGTSTHAFYWDGSRDGEGNPVDMQDLGSLYDDNSFGEAINENDQVVGVSAVPDSGPYDAIKREAFEGNVIEGIDSLGRPVDEYSYAYDINGSGFVVGAVTLNAALGLGDDGFSFNAVIWEDGEMNSLYDLLVEPDSGWFSLENALGINEDGWIVGYGRLAIEIPGYGTYAGDQHAFLLIPDGEVGVLPAVVPVPSALGLCLVGLCAAFPLRRRLGNIRI
ncbi:MAG: DUF3466 family protein [Sedimentisphaerales bacterium]|nr:DUF3466 family protein [Sedimentisphaerales bacterium]